MILPMKRIEPVRIHTAQALVLFGFYLVFI